jgi:hypothetical protein
VPRGAHSGAKGAHSSAREEKALENGRRWRMAGAGEWQALENGRRWRMAGAGEWQVLRHRFLLAARTGWRESRSRARSPQNANSKEKRNGSRAYVDRTPKSINTLNLLSALRTLIILSDDRFCHLLALDSSSISSPLRRTKTLFLQMRETGPQVKERLILTPLRVVPSVRYTATIHDG